MLNLLSQVTLMHNRLEILENTHEDNNLERATEKNDSFTPPTTAASVEIEDYQTFFLDADNHKPDFRRKRSSAIDLDPDDWGPQNFEDNSDSRDLPVEMAITNNQIPLAMDLLNRKYPAFYRTILFIHAVKQGCLEIVTFMIKDKWDVNDFKLWNKTTPLITAIVYNQPQIASTLIAFGADIEHKDQLGRSPLMYAAMNCRIKMTKLLVDLGANIFARDNNGNNVLDLLRQKTLCAGRNQGKPNQNPNRKIIIYKKLLNYLNSRTKFIYELNNHAFFSNDMSMHLILQFKPNPRYFPQDLSSIVFSFLDTKYIWLLWVSSSSVKPLTQPTYPNYMLNIIKAHASANLFAMPKKQQENNDFKTEELDKKICLIENP